MSLAQLGGLRWKPGTRIIVRGTWKRRIELLYVGGQSGTLLVVNNGRTHLPSPDSNHGDTSLETKISVTMDIYEDIQFL
jgi:hypothetical protein